MSLLYLLGSIILTSYLTLSFKVVERFRLDNLQVIVFNYYTCVITGSIFSSSYPVDAIVSSSPWLKWAVFMGIVFVLLFNLIAYTAQKIGIAVASVANKLSLVIPFAFSMYLYNEHSTVLKISGIILALVSVILTCFPRQQEVSASGKRFRPLFIVLPVLLFAGSGLLDTMIKYVEQTYLDGTNNDDYLILAFSSAAVAGTLLLLIRQFSRATPFNPRAILAGIAIGIPNYFSIWCLVAVLKINPGNSSAIIPLNNMGIVLFSSIVAFLIFKERLTAINWAGIILSLGAIALIAYG